METASPAPRLSTMRDMAVAKPKTWSFLISGGMDRALGSVMTSTTDGPWWASAVVNADSRSLGFSTRMPCMPMAVAICA